MKIPTHQWWIRIISILILLSVYLMVDVVPVSAVSIIVDTTNDEEIDDSTCSLREAYYAAKNHTDYYGCVGGASAYISLPAGIFTLDSNLSPSLNTAITISGESAATTIIQASSCNPTEETCTNDHQFVWISSSGDLTLMNLTLRNWKNTGDLNGGAIYNAGDLDISDSIMTNNRASYGGAIVNNGGTLFISTSTFSSNLAHNGTALVYGGAIHNSLTGFVNIDESTFSGNSAEDGGAILNNGYVTARNSTFSGNSAASQGGAIDNAGTLDLLNCSFVENSAASGAGIYNSGGASLNFINTIVANSISGSDCYIVDEEDIWTNTDNMDSDGSCWALHTGGSYIGPLADNGGPTQTHALLSDSVAIDYGNFGECPGNDQRGVTRPQGYGCDIGAYEWVPVTPLYLPLILR